jgi:hypothetical protein
MAMGRITGKLVAEACNHPNCLVLLIRLELIRLAPQAACEVGHKVGDRFRVADHANLVGLLAHRGVWLVTKKN